MVGVTGNVINLLTRRGSKEDFHGVEEAAVPGRGEVARFDVRGSVSTQPVVLYEMMYGIENMHQLASCGFIDSNNMAQEGTMIPKNNKCLVEA